MRIIRVLPSLVLALGSWNAMAADDHDHDHQHGHQGTGFYGHLHAKVLFDHVYDAEESDEEINEAYTHSHLELGYGFENGLSFNTNLELEGEPGGHDHHGGGSELDGNNRYFEDTPLFVRSLTVNYDRKSFGLYAGKFDPVISLDQHAMPGIYGYQIVDEYTVREKIGFGGYGQLNAGDYGKHRLDVSTFFSDTTFLSNSVLHERGQTKEEDGALPIQKISHRLQFR